MTYRSIEMTAKLVCRLVIAGLVFVLVAGCAVKQPVQPAQNDMRDPWEGFNRSVFSFNEGFDKVLFKPVAQGYRKITPDFVEDSIGNFFSNLGDVPVVANDILQGKFGQALSDTIRFLLNTTVGILGLFDVASSMGYIKHNEDFGQTLAVWGVGSGPYLMIPILGPSTVRDFPSFLVDRLLLHPSNYIGDSDTQLVLNVTEAVQTRADFLDDEEIIRQWSPDFYVALKNYHLSRRQALINDGSVAEEDIYKDL